MTATETAKEILFGYGRASKLSLEHLLEVQDWQSIARLELLRRATTIVQSMDNATLEAIASGQIDLLLMCQQVLAELERE